MRLLFLCFFFMPILAQDCFLPRSIPPAKLPVQSPKSFGEFLVQSAERFVDQPYLGGTLDLPAEECLVLSFERFDCTTFCETALAVARAEWLGKDQVEAIAAQLEWIRYRGGRRASYLSRLHYTLDWIWDNQEKAVLIDITQQLGGEAFSKPIFFMSEHPGSYPRLRDQDQPELCEIEAQISARTYYQIPKARIAEIEPLLQDGDILCFVTDTPGLDISHLGLAVREGKRARLFHASTTHKRVTRDPDFLADYCATKKRQTGLIVLRPLPPERTESGPTSTP